MALRHACICGRVCLVQSRSLTMWDNVCTRYEAWHSTKVIFYFKLNGKDKPTPIHPADSPYCSTDLHCLRTACMRPLCVLSGQKLSLKSEQGQSVPVLHSHTLLLLRPSWQLRCYSSKLRRHVIHSCRCAENKVPSSLYVCLILGNAVTNDLKSYW